MSNLSIGILGGSFDPIHNAHIQLAKNASIQCALDMLVFMPARQAALKDNTACTTTEHRLKMLELATSKLDINFSIDTFEINRQGVSYSIDTAKYMKKKYPDAKIIWIIGSDHISKLHKWKDIDLLCEIVEYACAKRPNYALDDISVPKQAKISYIDFTPLEISSTNIRDYIRNQKNLERTLDIDVISYIKQNKLYQ